MGGSELGTPKGDFENGDGFEIERRNVVGFEFKRFKKSTEEGNSSSIDGNEEENYSKDSNFVKKLNLSNCDFLVSELENESISKECNGENLLQSGSRFNKEHVVTVSICKYGVIRDVTHFWVPPIDCQKPNFDQILGFEATLDALSKGVGADLFLSEEAVRIDGLEAMNFEVKNLIVLDGTWSKAKRMYKENPWLTFLPHLKLDLDKMSLYSEARTQPKAGYLSTIESIVYALKALGDNNIEGLNNLLDVFESMVGDQRRCKDERLIKIPPVPLGAHELDDDDLGLNEEDFLGLNELDDPDDAGFGAQNQRGGPAAGAGTGLQEPSVAQMMQRMNEQLELNTQCLRTMNQQMTSNHNTYMSEYAGINERLDAFQRGLVSRGVEIPFMYRREGRRSFWGAGSCS
ncbi:hypothetical protein EZV62_014324 [Acer yangbiense]|uniref:tRNA-uridine aminocarboxypropyltransferase n=1 Tax=Acer yangbiense TaxID=1000413 RepID=A0A5C7HRR8_9ROSI|nr:hypothetical protein EZV62_014324 [Acer yangbiense]